MKKRTQIHEIVDDVEVLTSDQLYSLSELCSICKLDETSVVEFIDYGVIVSESSEAKYFTQRQLQRLLRGRRLQHDLELNHAGVALALDLLETIEQLKQDLERLKR